MVGIGGFFFAKLIDTLSRISSMPKKRIVGDIRDFLGIEPAANRTFHEQKPAGCIADLHVVESRMRPENGHLERFEAFHVVHFAVVFRSDIRTKLRGTFDFVQKVPSPFGDHRRDRIEQYMGKLAHDA